MKQTILFLSSLAILAFAMPLRAQEPSSIMALDNNNHYYYKKVFLAEGKTKTDMYKAFKNWIVKNIKGGTVSSYYDDAENNTISTNPMIALEKGARVDFKLNIDLKDGKYKVEMTDFIFHYEQGLSKPFGDYSGLFAPNSYRKKALKQVDEAVVVVLDALEYSLTEAAQSDW